MNTVGVGAIDGSTNEEATTFCFPSVIVNDRKKDKSSMFASCSFTSEKGLAQVFDDSVSFVLTRPLGPCARISTVTVSNGSGDMPQKCPSALSRIRPGGSGVVEM